MWPRIMMTFAFTSMVMLIEAAPHTAGRNAEDGEVVLMAAENPNARYLYMQPQEQVEPDWAEVFSQPDPRMEKRSVALSRLNFRPGKRSVPLATQADLVEQGIYRLNALQKRSVAISRKGFRPAKK
ncbi:unnamed protein product [Bursaphelenchus xylophilus]|nr:unnamed protein product [Bursaphelenchus xylophilus]CAG9128456.1 unnamed protein product [Bursaphelenchus xylophilus]